jgi:hypothetical protein
VATDTDLALRNERRDWRPAALEGTASLIAMLAIVVLFGNWLDSYLTFFGAPVVVTEEEVRTYWITLAALVVAVVTSFGAAVWRGSRWAWAWHVLVGIVGAAAAVLFAVTTVGTPHEDPVRPPSPSGPGAPGCHSGGDSSGCPGG